MCPSFIQLQVSTEIINYGAMLTTWQLDVGMSFIKHTLADSSDSGSVEPPFAAVSAMSRSFV